MRKILEERRLTLLRLHLDLMVVDRLVPFKQNLAPGIWTCFSSRLGYDLQLINFMILLLTLGYSFTYWSIVFRSVQYSFLFISFVGILSVSKAMFRSSSSASLMSQREV